MQHVIAAVEGTSLEFQTPDLAGWLWILAGALALVELARYLVAGRRRGAMLGRILLLIPVAALAALVIRTGFQPGHVAAALIVLVLASAWIARGYSSAPGTGASRGHRAALMTLRIAVLAGVATMVARPVITYTRIQRDRASLGILLDNSRSMSVRDVPGESQSSPTISRAEAVHQALEKASDALRRAGDDLDLHWYLFDVDTRERHTPRIAGDGRYTALADAAGRARQLLTSSGRKPAGLILISDGRDTFSRAGDPTGPADALTAAGIPLFTVGVGSEEPSGETRALQARRLDAPTRVTVLNRMPVRGEFLALGLAESDVAIELLYDDAVVDTRRMTPTEARELLSADLMHVPDAPGLHRVTVRARSPRLPGGDAVLHQLVEVTDERIRVLYIDRPRYERAAVARALDASGEFLVTRTDTGPGAPLADLGTYDVVLFGDVEASSLPPRALALVLELVTRSGRGLGLLGGLRTLSGGDWDATALRSILPMGTPARDKEETVAFELTPAGRAHAICRLRPEPDANLAAWSALSPALSASRIASPGPAAEVLVKATDGAPLLVVQEAGRGRTASIGFDATWNWSFSADEGAELTRRFWRQVVLWLANRRPQVWVTTDRARYELALLQASAEQVLVRAGVTRPIGGPPGEPSLKATVKRPNGRTEDIRWQRGEDGFHARLEVDAPGAYHIRVAGSIGGQPVGRAETAFTVEAVDVEMQNPLADLETLRRMSAATGTIGGEYVSLSGLGPLLDRIRAAGTVTEIAHVRRVRAIEDHPWAAFGLLLGLLATEWTLRRRWSLV